MLPIKINNILNNYTLNYTLNSRVLSSEEIKQGLDNYLAKNSKYNTYVNNPNKFGYYLAGLLEGDGHISIPALFKNSKLTRVLNPNVVLTSHVSNLGLYAWIQSELGGIGRFQISGNNIRYIIGDIKGIQLLIKLVHGKFRTPKNITFNNLIQFLNNKYSLGISESLLDSSDYAGNSWLTGFTEADGHFAIKYVESKPKSETRKRGVSESVTLKFRLDQRAFDKPTFSSMLPFMETLSLFLTVPVKSYSSNKSGKEVLSLTVSAIDGLKPLVNYFDKYPLLGDKYNNYVKWNAVYHMVVAKQHLTPEGRMKIRALIV